MLVLDLSLYPQLFAPLRSIHWDSSKAYWTQKRSRFKGAHFSRENHFLPDIITELWQQRDIAKDPKMPQISGHQDLDEFLLRIMAQGCRFYDTRLASSITMRGHEIMQTTAWIGSFGHGVRYRLYLCVAAKQSSPEEAQTIGKQLADFINHKWREKLKAEFALECYLDLEFETHQNS